MLPITWLELLLSYVSAFNNVIDPWTVWFELPDPLTCGYFSVVNAAVLHDPQLVQSAEVEELWMQRAGN